MTQPAPFSPPPSPDATPSSKLPLVALVVGIVALLMALLPVLGALVGVAAIILGVLVLRRRDRRALGGIALGLGALAVVGSLLATAMFSSMPPNEVAERPAPTVIDESSQPVEESPEAVEDAREVVEEESPTSEAQPETVAEPAETPTETPADIPTETVGNLAEQVSNAVLMDGVYDSFQAACVDGIGWICQIIEIKPGPGATDVEVHAVAGEASWEDIIRGVANFSCSAGVKPDWIIVYQNGVVQEQDRTRNYPICNVE